jgi:hypothetical protein
MRKLFLIVALFCASPAWGAIAFVGASSTCGTWSSGTSLTVTYTSAGGHQILVGVSVKPTTATVSSVSDAGSSYGSSPLGSNNNASSYRTELWGTTSSTASTTFTVNFAATPTAATACVSEYSGGSAFGAVASGNQASGTSWVRSVTTTAANSWAIGTVTVNASEASYTGTAPTTVRTSNAGSATFQNMVADNNSCGASGSTCSVSGTYPTSHTNSQVTVELKLVASQQNKPPVVL